jgi:hypothetical protein
LILEKRAIAAKNRPRVAIFAHRPSKKIFLLMAFVQFCAIMRHEEHFCTSGWQSRVGDPSGGSV